MKKIILSICILNYAFCISTQAQWSTTSSVDNPLGFTVSGNAGSYFNSCSDGAGGAFYAWYASQKIFINRIDMNGYIQWGTAVTVDSGFATPFAPGLVVDGATGAFIHYAQNSTVKLQHIDATGNLQWAVAKTLFFNVTSVINSASVSKGNNALYIAALRGGGSTGVIVQKVDFNGVPQFDSSGVLITNFYDYRQPRVLPDGAGGLVTSYEDHIPNNNHVRIQRVDSSGVALWTTNGIILDVISVLSFPQIRFVKTSDNNFLTAWTTASNAELLIQKFDTSGNFLWGSNEAVVCNAAGGQNDPAMLADSSGGAWIAWRDGRNLPTDIYIQHFDAAGNATCAINGLEIYSLNSYIPVPVLARDGSMGVKVFWQGQPAGNGLTMQRVDVNCNRGCAVNGVPVTATDRHVMNSGTVVQSSANTNILFIQSNSGAMYAKYIPAGCPFTTGIEENIEGGNMLAVYPNPANQSVVISWQFAENEKIELKILDVMGKEIYSLHEITSNFKLQTSNLANGIYIVQLTTENKIFAQKLIVQH